MHTLNATELKGSCSEAQRLSDKAVFQVYFILRTPGRYFSFNLPHLKEAQAGSGIAGEEHLFLVAAEHAALAALGAVGA